MWNEKVADGPLTIGAVMLVTAVAALFAIWWACAN